MLLMRCAWHPKYRGYPWLYGIRSWRGAGVSFSDGMCGPCARQWRAEFRSGRVRLGDDPPSLPQLVPGWTLRVGLGIALATAVIFAASPLDLPANREIAAPGGTPRSPDGAQALPATVTYAHLAPEPSPRIERAAAPTVEPPCVGSPPVRSRQFTPLPSQRASAVPARGAVVAHVSRRPPTARLVTTVAVSAPPVTVVPVQAP